MSPMASTQAQILVASNRGPISYALDEIGTLKAKRGGGGLVSGLSAIGPEAGALWVCSALGDGDREAVRRGVGEEGVRMLDIPADVHEDAYNGVANSVLWFVNHMLYQTPLEPLRRRIPQAMGVLRDVQPGLRRGPGRGGGPGRRRTRAGLPPDAGPRMLRELRPDLRIGHFSHTPWAPPEYFRMLPDDIAAQLLDGILGADRAAFLTQRWADAFTDCCHAVLGPAIPSGTRIGVHGLGADADFLRKRSHEADVNERIVALREQIGEGRKAIVRVDRTELSKNIVRGLLAYRQLLEDQPSWRERVVHVALAYPSRQDLAVYRDYMAEVRRLADEINSQYGTPGWTPVVLHLKDDFARSLAAYRLADVALVNPIRDGMNLVAKEVPVVSDEGCALVLSREAGAYEELGEDAIVVNPYDVVGTARALHSALTMPRDERAERTKRLAASATALPPAQWFLDQLEALRSAG